MRRFGFAKSGRDKLEGELKSAGEVHEPVLRLFVAISLPEAVKNEIAQAQAQIRGALREDFIRWTKREQFHLTLKFLGNVAEARVTELTEALRGACAPFAALPLRAERIGFFPDTRFPRVVWASVHDAQDSLRQLQQAVEASIGGFAEKRDEKEFTGHVTLGRMQRITRPQAEILAKLAYGMGERFFGEWIAKDVELIRSELSSGGSRYTTLATIPLSGTT